MASTKVRQKDIAEKLNISRTTVARAFSGKNISEKMKEQVLSVAKEMGYVHNSVATMLAIKSSKTVYCFTIGTVDEGYSEQVIEGLQDAIKVWNGYPIELTTYVTDIKLCGNKCCEQMAQFYDAMEKETVDGVLFSALSQENMDSASAYCHKRNIPLMSMDYLYKNTELCHIGSSHYDLGIITASFLAGQMRNKGRILTITYDDGYDMGKIRMESFYKKLEEFPQIKYLNIDVDNIGYGTYKKALKEYVPSYCPDVIYAPFKMDYVVQALRSLGYNDDYIMISNGINSEIERYLFDGTLCGIVSARPYQVGAIAMTNFIKYFYRMPEMLKTEIDTGHDIFIKENYYRFNKMFY